MIEVRCPNCGEQTLVVNCHKEDKTVRCGNCDEEYTPSELRKISEDLVTFAQWVEAAPFLT